MLRVKLTKRLVEELQPDNEGVAAAEGRAKLRDIIAWDSEVPGFGVKVTPAGTRVYFVYYRTASGQQRRPKIGNHGILTVDQARQIARQWMAGAAVGEDVSAERMSRRADGTVAQLAKRYLEEYADLHKKPSSVATDRANIENHVIPVLGPMLVREVTRKDIDGLKMAVKEGRTARQLKAKPRGRRVIRGGQGIANRVVALASKMFSCAQEWGLREDNPASGVRKFREHRKDRFLDKAEVGRLLQQLQVAEETEIVSRTAVAAIRVLLFTGMRCGEVLNLRWADVDDNQMCFRLPDSKTGRRVIPYGEHVRDALRSLNRGEANQLVFEGAKKGAPLSLRRPWYKLRIAAEIDQSATLHTLRHTFASWSVMSGLSLPQVGALLGHKSTQTTLRYADHAIEATRAYSEKTSTVLAAMLEKDDRPADS